MNLYANQRRISGKTKPKHTHSNAQYHEKGQPIQSLPGLIIIRSIFSTVMQFHVGAGLLISCVSIFC